MAESRLLAVGLLLAVAASCLIGSVAAQCFDATGGGDLADLTTHIFENSEICLGGNWTGDCTSSSVLVDTPTTIECTVVRKRKKRQGGGIGSRVDALNRPWLAEKCSADDGSSLRFYGELKRELAVLRLLLLGHKQEGHRRTPYTTLS